MTRDPSTLLTYYLEDYRSYPATYIWKQTPNLWMGVIEDEESKIILDAKWWHSDIGSSTAKKCQLLCTSIIGKTKEHLKGEESL